MVFKKLVNIVQDTSNGSPFIVEVVPQYTVQDQIANRIPNDTDLATMIAETLKEEVIKAVRRFNSWPRERILKNVKGYLIADNGDNNKNSTTSVSLKNLSVESLLFSFEHIQQSNLVITVHDLEWSYQLDPNTIQSGGTAPPVPPSWAPRKRYRDTWEEQMFNGVVINCAAFALTVLANSGLKIGYGKLRENALKLQRKLDWGSDVDFGELAKIVEEWPKVKVVLLDGKTSTVKIRFTGDEYVFDGKTNIFYLYHYQDFKLGLKHYAACESPLMKKMIVTYNWCHSCSVYYSRAKGHECDIGIVEAKKNSSIKACKKCKVFGEHNCPLIQCSKCSVVYPRGSKEIHRCAIELKDKRGEKSWFYGDARSETSEANGKYPAILAYDLESAFEKVECSKREIVETLLDDDYRFDENAYNSVTYDFYYERHVANLVYVMDIFTGQEWQFFGDDCLSDFIDFLFSYNEGNCQAWAHNGSGYDTRLIFEAVVKKMLNPQKISQIMSGSRFMELRVDKLVFRDSLRHLPGSLKKLAHDFCKDKLMKGDFPFMFNRKEYYDYIGPIPSLEYYPVAHVKTDDDLKKLLTYHASWKDREDWNFKEQLVAYCRNDVLILADILKKYHQICFDFSEQSPLGFITGPGFVHSYCGNESFRQITRDCPPPEMTDVDSYRAWLNHIAKEKYWCVLSPYEHYFAAKSLRGGRTENRSFRCVLSEEDYENGMRIGYTDVVSMYPSVQIDELFPVGAPTIFVKDVKYWPCPDHHPLEFSCHCGDRKKKMFYRYGVIYDLVGDCYDLVNCEDFFGIVCCTVIPPKNIIHPYFMQKNEMMDKNIGSLLDEDHIEVVMTSLELKEMIQYGYQLVDIHCYHKYNKGNFWKEPTLKLYLEKMLNSGEAPKTDDDKEAFVKPWIEKYGEEFGDLIKDSWDRWGKNPAKRAVAKTMMNSVWGKQAQRPVLPKNFLFGFKESSDDIATYFRNCDSNARKHQSTVMIGDDYMLNTCIDLKAIPSLHGQYMPAACFVTAASRSKLYKEIWNLGKRALYMDTDSIIFTYKIGNDHYMPPEGSMVGEWETDGMIDKHGDIMEFISFAPKTYGLKFRDGFKVVKAKGMSLSRATENQFNYEIMKEAVEDFLNDGVTEKIKVTQSGIGWCLKNGMKSIFNLKEIGIQPEHFKGIVREGYIYPFGFDFSELYE